MSKSDPIYINVAKKHLIEMDEAENSYDKNQAALSAMTAIISALDENGPYVVLSSLLSHVTIMQPDPNLCLQWIVEGATTGWQAHLQAGKVLQQQ